MRIYADFNALGGRGDDCALMLHRSGTLQDLHRLRLRLAEGETHTFWDQSDEEEDLEVDGLAGVYAGRIGHECQGGPIWRESRVGGAPRAG